MSSIPAQIQRRCDQLALSFVRAQRFASEEGQTAPQALARVLGLDSITLQPLEPRRWLWMAAQSASVSYRCMFTDEQLLAVLRAGHVRKEHVPHISTLLDETPVQIVVMALLQASQLSEIPMSTLWKNVRRLSLQVKSHRQAIWDVGP
jgi:hypothetical protein